MRYFIWQAEDWQRVKNDRRLKEKERLEKLHEFAAEIRDMVRDGFKDRAEHYLGAFARRLSDSDIAREALLLTTTVYYRQCTMSSTLRKPVSVLVAFY